MLCSIAHRLYRTPYTGYQSRFRGHRLQGELISLSITERTLLMILLGIDRLPTTLQLRCCIRQNVNPSILPKAFPYADVPAHCLCSYVHCLRLMPCLRRRRHFSV